MGKAAFSEGLAVWRVSLGVSERVSAISATSIVVTAITFITIIFDELLAARIGQLHPKPVSVLAMRPMAWVASVAKPFVRLLAFSTHVILTLLSIGESASTTVTEQEIGPVWKRGAKRVGLRHMSTRWCAMFCI
ncbi:CNNM domain-containing protein [Comamonas testosteroni]|nr:CNNM domain-containing protein [Comamonas testosteroni]WQG69420.1 CNNM domain-containing protein [Comamonas testosteroni]